MAKKRSITVRLTPYSGTIVETIENRLGINTTEAIEVALRSLAYHVWRWDKADEQERRWLPWVLSIESTQPERIERKATPQRRPGSRDQGPGASLRWYRRIGSPGLPGYLPQPDEFATLAAFAAGRPGVGLFATLVITARAKRIMPSAM